MDDSDQQGCNSLIVVCQKKQHNHIVFVHIFPGSSSNSDWFPKYHRVYQTKEY